MELRIIREPSVAGTTLGVVFLDGAFFGFSLEDQVREQPGVPVEAWKVYGETAIPAGRYRVTLTFSPRFGRLLPELRDVPGFTAIRIHPGNSKADTEGCILLGVERRDVRVLQSTATVGRLQAAIEAALGRGEVTWVTIENTPALAGALTGGVA